MFADDLNAYKELEVETPNEEGIKEAKTCQEKLHAWGNANQVTFEPKKESFHREGKPKERALRNRAPRESSKKGSRKYEKSK